MPRARSLERFDQRGSFWSSAGSSGVSPEFQKKKFRSNSAREQTIPRTDSSHWRLLGLKVLLPSIQLLRRFRSRLERNAKIPV